MTKVRDLFEIPEQIRKMDFTVTLTESVGKVHETVSSYVITPKLTDAFDQALGMIKGATQDNRSQGAYLHGSFGSGKSHFMAMLSLLLADDEEAWGRPELHPLRPKHEWVGSKKVMKLHLHMLGKPSIEAGIFPAYLAYIREHHPDAGIPGVFADEELFDDAGELLESLGDEKFFGPMNALVGADEEDDDWGELADLGQWDRSRFSAARDSTDPGERAKLLNGLVSTHFKAFRNTRSNFRDIDLGLKIISAHAKELGYDAIVLFLDELILRLSMGASDPNWLDSAVQSMVKLVDYQERPREVPIVSFVARQRDLAEMVGDKLAGPDNARLREVLELAKGRFGTVNLGDENLPSIVEKRILKPKGDEAKATLDQAFSEVKRGAGDAWDTLLGGTHDAADFRKLYPFSPVLVDALVALSGSLQRQRTSIKLLTEILVDHIHDLELGDLVGVGDLWDVLATGDESASGIMRERFKAANRLYRHDLLPMIQKAHGTDTKEKCQRMRDDHPVRLGCSNCGETHCRNDNRVVKTLIVAALVRGVPAFKDLSARRLVELNHGKLKAPVKGYESKLVAERLRSWAGQLGELRVGDEADPRVSLELQGVDIRPIMEAAREFDATGRRQSLVRDLLFQSMGLPTEVEAGLDYSIKWRASKREGHIRFGNVRRMGPDVLRCADAHDWRLVVDYPFDEPAFGPTHDELVLDDFRDKFSGSWTLVWLPSFFSEAINKVLGELVVLNHILDTGTATTDKYVQHFNVEQRDLALTSLRNLQSQKRSQVMEAIRKAYGIQAAGADDPQLDPANHPERHLQTLQPGLDIRPGIAADLSVALEKYIHALLLERYPQHPNFGQPISGKRVERVLSHFAAIVDANDKKIALEKDDLKDMRGILGEMGLVRVTENAALLRSDDTLQDIEQRRMQAGVDHPTAAQIAQWYDPDGKTGLVPEAMGVVIRAYARATARTLVSHGEPFEYRAAKAIPDHVVLEKPDLPELTEWRAALEAAGSYFGIALPGYALHGDNLKRLEAELRKALAAQAHAAVELPAAIRTWNHALGLEGTTDRLGTANKAEELVVALQGQPAVQQVRVLAAFEAKPSREALGRSLANGPSTLAALENDLSLGVFRQLVSRAGDDEEIHAVLEKGRKALRQDELSANLAERLRQLAVDGQRLITEPVAPPVTEGKVVFEASLQADGKDAALTELERVVGEARQKVAEGGDGVSLRGSITITEDDG